MFTLIYYVAYSVRTVVLFTVPSYGGVTTGFSRIVTEWHKAVRRVIQLPYCTHRWLLGPLSGQRNIIEQLHCKTALYCPWH